MGLADGTAWENEFGCKRILTPKYHNYTLELCDGTRFSVVASSEAKAFELVVSAEAYYNPDWGYKLMWYSSVGDTQNGVIKQGKKQ